MNFDLDDDQQSIQRSAREMLAARYKPEEVRRLALEEEHGFTEQQWTEMVELGWPGLIVSEDHGGIGLGMVELAVIAEQLGYALAPTPLQSTWAAGMVLAELGDTDWLPRLAAGEARGAVGIPESPGSWFVPDAAVADVIVLGGAVVTDFEPEKVEALDPTRRLYRVREVGGDHQDRVAHHQQLVLQAAENVGIAQRTMEMAVEYAKERKQFGKPIGVHQGVSHRCAQMLLETEGARALVYNAAWAIDNDPGQAPLAAAMANAYASDAAVRVVSSSIQVHGGIGFTWEHDLHFFLKRAQANAHVLGSSREQRARVADLVFT